MTLRQRQILIRDKAHLDFVRSQSCCVCGRVPRSAAAHIRFSDAAAGAVNPGMQRRPCDSKTVPLCDPGCHKEAPGSQHDGNEREFWERVGLDPRVIAARLWIESGAAARHADGPVRKPRQRKERPRPKGPKREWASRPFPAGRGFNR